MRGSIRTAFLLAAGLLLAGCRPAADKSSTITMDWTVTPSPPVAGPVLVVLTLTDRGSGRPLPGATVGITGDMTHPGMKPVFATAREVAPGRYEAPVELTMAGDWVISVDARLRDGRRFERQFELRGVRPR
jgi:hypothetical protein